MWRKISDRVHGFSVGWVTFFALIVFVLFMVLVLPAESRRAEADSGGSGSPDTSLFYTPADLYRMAEAYGHDITQVICLKLLIVPHLHVQFCNLEIWYKPGEAVENLVEILDWCQ